MEAIRKSSTGAGAVSESSSSSAAGGGAADIKPEDGELPLRWFDWVYFACPLLNGSAWAALRWLITFFFLYGLLGKLFHFLSVCKYEQACSEDFNWLTSPYPLPMTDPWTQEQVFSASFYTVWDFGHFVYSVTWFLFMSTLYTAWWLARKLLLNRIGGWLVGAVRHSRNVRLAGTATQRDK